jgi:hypothetical protein
MIHMLLNCDVHQAHFVHLSATVVIDCSLVRLYITKLLNYTPLDMNLSLGMSKKVSLSAQTVSKSGLQLGLSSLLSGQRVNFVWLLSLHFININ